MPLEFKLRFLVLPDYVYSDNRLNATDIKVYSFINSYKGDKFYFTNEQLANMFGVDDRSIKRAVARLVKFGLIQADYEIKSGGGTIRFIKNLREDKVVTSERTTLSSDKGQSWPTKDNKVKANKIKEISILKNKEKSLLKENKYPTPEDVTEADLQEIADHYKVPIHFVRSKHEDMLLWVAERPGNVKLKGRNWRMTLMNWVKRDAIKIAERRGDGTKRPIDARNI